MGDSRTSADRRDEILDHAFQLAGESGLASLTMKKIAERIGFTETAAYRYFPNKDALLLGMVEKLGETMLTPIRRIAGSVGTPEDRLERMLRHHVDFVLRLDGLPMLLIAEAAATGKEELLERFRQTLREYVTLVSLVLSESPAAVSSVRPQELAVFLMGIPLSLAIRRRVGADPELEERVRADLIPFIVQCVTGKAGGGESGV
jgi:AcrR family transcriptional regulator